MTIRQKLLKTFYPAVMLLSKLSGATPIITNDRRVQPKQSFYDLEFSTISRDDISMEVFKGKKVLLVNTASDCGFTAQLKELQQLQDEFKDELVIIGFPSNDFKQQEPQNDEEISTFCQLNFSVKFTLAKKSSVVKGPQQHPVYQWLSSSDRNGWNNSGPAWNFTKYLVDENGMLTHVFPSGKSPLDSTVKRAISTLDNG